MFTRRRLPKISELDAFSRLTGGLIVALIAVCGVLALLNVQQGPRVRTAVIDRKAVAETANRRLVLHTSQPVGQLKEQHVVIKPQASFKVISAGNTILLQFTQPLRYDTEYTVTFTTPDRRHSFKYSFMTDQPDVFYAVNEGVRGTIYRRNLYGGEAVRLFEGDAVNDFLVAGRTMVIVTQRPDGKSGLRLQNTDQSDQLPTIIDLPQPGIVLGLRAAPDRRSFGFRFTAGNAHSAIVGQLGMYDIAKNKLSWVPGVDGKPVSALDWQYAADSQSLLVQTFDSSAFVLKPGVSVVPLGQFIDIGGFSYDDTSIVAYDSRAGETAVSLKTLSPMPIAVPKGNDSIAEAIPLRTAAGYLLQTDFVDGEQFGQRLYVQRDKTLKELLTIRDEQGFIRNSSISPNDQFVVIEKGKEASGIFAYDIIDTFTGPDKKTPLLSMDAAMVRWRQ